VTTQQKRSLIEDIKTKVKAAESKLTTARNVVADASQPIDKARGAFTDGKEAIEAFKPLETQLEQITP
jgi:hypothetical protein